MGRENEVMGPPFPPFHLKNRTKDFLRAPVKKWWRYLYWWRLDRATQREFSGIATAIFYGASLGDNLLCTAFVREWYARHGGPLAVLTPFPEFFLHNPYVHTVRHFHPNQLASLERVGVRVIRPDYRVPAADPDRDIPPVRHIIADMCAGAGLSGLITLNPELFFTAGELTAQKPAIHSGSPVVAIMSGGSAAVVPMKNKEWPSDRWQRVVELGRDRCDFVQLGSPLDQPLSGVRDLRGKTSLRETALFLKTCSAFVGQIGFLMHLARSVDCPSVIVYGGRERPDQSGYSCNENLYSAVPCAPCWRYNGCEHARVCLDAIGPDQVWTAVERRLSRPQLPMSKDVLTV